MLAYFFYILVNGVKLPQPEFCYELFDRLIAPILMYESEVWGFHSADAVERVHLSFCSSSSSSSSKSLLCVTFRHKRSFK